MSEKDRVETRLLQDSEKGSCSGPPAAAAADFAQTEPSSIVAAAVATFAFACNAAAVLLGYFAPAFAACTDSVEQPQTSDTEPPNAVDDSSAAGPDPDPAADPDPFVPVPVAAAAAPVVVVESFQYLVACHSALHFACAEGGTGFAGHFAVGMIVGAFALDLTVWVGFLPVAAAAADDSLVVVVAVVARQVLAPEQLAGANERAERPEPVGTVLAFAESSETACLASPFVVVPPVEPERVAVALDQVGLELVAAVVDLVVALKIHFVCPHLVPGAEVAALVVAVVEQVAVAPSAASAVVEPSVAVARTFAAVRAPAEQHIVVVVAASSAAVGFVAALLAAVAA